MVSWFLDNAFAISEPVLYMFYRIHNIMMMSEPGGSSLLLRKVTVR